MALLSLHPLPNRKLDDDWCYEVPNIERVRLSDDKIDVLLRMVAGKKRFQYGKIDSRGYRGWNKSHPEAAGKPYAVEISTPKPPDPDFFNHSLGSTVKYEFFDDAQSMEAYLMNFINETMRAGWST